MEIEGPSRGALVWIALLAVMLPTAIIVAGQAVAGRPLDVPLVLASLAFTSLTALSLAALCRRRWCRIDGGMLRIGSTFYTVRVPLAEIDPDGITAVTVERGSPYWPRYRSNGVAFPGYQSGWFVTRGEGKAFIVRRSAGCVRLKSRRGLLLLLGAEDPQAAARQFAAALAAARPAQPA